MLLFILLLLSSFNSVQGVISFRDVSGYNNGNIMANDNTIIPFSQNSGSADTTKTFSIIYKDNEGFVAINRDGKPLFTVFPFDNGPDYLSEGLFRIVEKKKIGFANEHGEIIIKPQFTAVLPFHGGLAAYCNDCIIVNQGEHKAWEKGKWGFIDTSGKIVIPAQYDKVINDFGEGHAMVEQNGLHITIDKKGVHIQKEDMNYHEWVRILGEVSRLINIVLLDDKAKTELCWDDAAKTYSFAFKDSAALVINVFAKKSDKLLVKYTVVPWQNFLPNVDENSLITPGAFDNLLTVTEYAVIFTSGSMSNLDPTESQYMEQFDTAFKKVINYDRNQTVIKDNDLDIPPDVQIISGNAFKHYIDLQIAIPGSSLPEYSRWATVAKNKMLHLSLVPDMGQVKSSWIKPANLNISTYYTSVEKELHELFAGAVDNSIKNPENRKQIFNTTKDSLRNVFSAANSYVNFLYNEYEIRLGRWLLLSEQTDVQSDLENMFPDYVPKTTPDTVTDLMPELSKELDKIPAGEPANIIQLINLLSHFQNRAKEKPGQWVDGNVILGANPRGYQPSPDELLAAETGNRLQVILHSEPKEQIQKLLQKEKVKKGKLEYIRFTFTHVDVMGSGRFFYVDTIETVKLDLE